MGAPVGSARGVVVTGRVVMTGRGTTGRVVAGVGIVWFCGVAALAVAGPA